jgi:hypothetical protein
VGLGPGANVNEIEHKSATNIFNVYQNGQLEGTYWHEHIRKAAETLVNNGMGHFVLYWHLTYATVWATGDEAVTVSNDDQSFDRQPRRVR